MHGSWVTRGQIGRGGQDRHRQTQSGRQNQTKAWNDRKQRNFNGYQNTLRHRDIPPKKGTERRRGRVAGTLRGTHNQR
eukprot:7537293-Lingulodinium_polyedra.AAC.1